MRIIAGEYRSRSLRAPKGEKTRPTSDRARETAFNILTNLISLEGTSVLDLFAGSGAFGFEALSRGAARITCVDNSKEAILAMELNVASLGVTERVKIIRQDVYRWIPQAVDSYNVIFADPPYDDNRLPSELLLLLFSSRLLTPDSIVIIEHRTGSRLELPPNAVLIKERSAGEANFTFLRTSGSETSS
ncbi:MAG TPA: 16S rRNA (guanine(966)-N(2))-methyltransferase RsmD [Candidatus Kapabacteria bacterium]|nr:16S rRNA (guanine(966)-N(2))-methyltransferase RsmD [Candidatus Kapabacteria bacterium]